MAENKTAIPVLGNPAESTGTCWSCGDMRAAHFCGSCGKVQPPTPVDYFTFFGLPRKLNVDIATLEKEFYELSRRLHPDLNAQNLAQEQQWSLEKSSQLNDAYRTLKDPIKRTQYLLKLEGIQLEEQSKTATEEARAKGEIKKQVVPPALLEEVFELNMQLEEMRMNKKMGERDPELAKEVEVEKQKLEARLNSFSGELHGYWHEWDRVVDRKDAEDERRKIVGKMVDLLNRRNYIRNLVRDVTEVLEA